MPMTNSDSPSRAALHIKPATSGDINDGLFREQFPILANNVYYDVAYKASAPNLVRQATMEYFDENQNTAGDKVSWANKTDDLRSKIARLIGAKMDEIAFVKNTSEGINLLAHSIAYRPGDNVVISDQEHAANDFPWTNLKQFGVEIRRIRSHDHRFDVDEIIPLVDSRTRAVSVSLVFQVSGFIPDIAGLAEFCRPKGIFLFLDAMQAVGGVPVRVDELGVDGLATSGHKWMLGPYGTGFLYARRASMQNALPVFASKHYTRLDLDDPNTALIKDAGRWEYGSLNYPGLFGLSAGVDMILALGDERIASHISELVGRLLEASEIHGFRPIAADRRNVPQSGILSFACKDSEAAAKAFRENGIYVSSRKGMIRTSQHFYNNVTDIDRFIDIARYHLK